MSNEKRSRGRPRKYPTNAARKKAYRERKKAEKLALEKRVKALAKELRVISTFEEPFAEIKDFNFEDIKAMSLTDLEHYQQLLEEKITTKFDLFSPLHILIDEILNDYLLVSKEVKKDEKESIIEKSRSSFLDFMKSLQLLTLKHIIEIELRNRKEEDIIEFELNVLEQKIDALEKELTKKKEAKITPKKNV